MERARGKAKRLLDLRASQRNSFALGYKAPSKLDSLQKFPHQSLKAESRLTLLHLPSNCSALARWGHGDAAIATTDLTDGCWYGGEGCNANMGLWDARKKSFWVTCITDSVMPSTYPAPGPRSVRLKREAHIHDGGTFRPLREIR